MTEFAYQLYGSREFPPLESTLRMLADLGYTQTEGYGGVYGDPAATRAAHEAVGLTMPSAHFSLGELEQDLNNTITVAGILGVSSIFCPYLQADERPTDAAGWTAIGHRLQAIGENCRNLGFNFGWHNHDFEFQPLADGQVPLRLILDAAPDIGWEADIAWIIRGGDDPFRYISEYGDRISAVHIKDIAPQGQNLDEDGWADLGQGTVEWAQLLQALTESPVKHFVLEHDKPSDDRRFAQVSLDFLKSIERATE